MRLKLSLFSGGVPLHTQFNSFFKLTSACELILISWLNDELLELVCTPDTDRCIAEGYRVMSGCVRLMEYLCEEKLLNIISD